MFEQLIATCARDPANELVRAECESLTEGTPDAFGIAPCRTTDYVQQAAYVQLGLRRIVQAPTLDQLVDRISTIPLDADEFRIECAKVLPCGAAASRRDVIVRVADALRGARPNLDAPRHRFYLAADASGLLFAEVVAATTHSYRLHDAKPYHTSTSLPTRLARAVVNLVARTAKTVLDPCCGTGSLLMEACAIGLRAHGSDWNPRMVGMSRQNVSRFDYDVAIDVEDARESTQRADAVVTNLPYGRNLQLEVDSIRGILANMAQAAPVGVFIAAQDMTDWLRAAGYEHVVVFRVPKYTGFVRYVHHARREASPSQS